VGYFSAGPNWSENTGEDPMTLEQLLNDAKRLGAMNDSVTQRVYQVLRPREMIDDLLGRLILGMLAEAKQYEHLTMMPNMIALRIVTAVMAGRKSSS
jgi:hypothetical protein